MGSWVVLSVAALASGLPNRLGGFFGDTLSDQLMALVGFVTLYTLIQLPFDVLGGYVLPKRYGRSHTSLPAFASTLARGGSVYAIFMGLVGASLLIAGRFGGVWAVAACGTTIACLLLLARLQISKLIARLHIGSTREKVPSGDGDLPVTIAESRDEGFTGGILGFLSPQAILLPAKWEDELEPEDLSTALRRRSLAASSGMWRKGRLAALALTALGISLSALLVGPKFIGTAGGIVGLSLWFTLWSFACLLVLPTPSRASIQSIETRLREQGVTEASLRRTHVALDSLQDGEPSRSSLVEAIFHPLPSVSNRAENGTTPRSLGLWDVARTTVFLGLAGFGLLGRAVHCNCGRPSLWVFLPCD